MTSFTSSVTLTITPNPTLPIGVRDNHTNCEPETQHWLPGMGFASAGPPFRNSAI